MKRIILAATVLACLAACGGRSPQPKYYMLDEAKSASAPETGAPGVILRRVSLPSYLDRDALVLRDPGAARLTVAEYHLWAEPLTKSVPRLLEESMRAAVQEKGLSLLWPDASDEALLLVDTTLLRLDGNPGTKVELAARWRVLDKKEKLLAQGVFEKEYPAGENYEQMVQAMSRLVDDCGRELARAALNAYDQLRDKSDADARKSGRRPNRL